MCGIWALLGDEYDAKNHGTEFLKIIGRGPDFTIVTEVAPKTWLGFHRLAIVDPGHGHKSSQPVVSDKLSVVCNGEIYNHMALKALTGIPETDLENGASDCAAIIHAFKAFNGNLKKACAALDGVFAFAMADDQFLYIGRDPIGVRPLFYGYTPTGSLVFGSEVKCIEKLCDRLEYFPPGSCAQIPLAGFASLTELPIQQYYAVPSIPDNSVTLYSAQTAVREILLQAVEKRLMGNRHFGFMLSGGLDSSIIASIASKLLKEKPIAFSVGFEDSPDLENARRVAEYLDIPHKVLVITPEECLNVIPEVIYALETFDPLIIRCGIAHYLLCRHIAATSDVKVLLSGEGADELFGSYAYMQRAPNAAHLHREALRRMKHLHQYDVLRCDRSTSCHGLEIRVPFLDKKFIEYVAKMPPTFKLIPNKLEKYVLRSAFEGWLPTEVLWRSKEGFAEALGKIDLGDVVAEHCEKLISDDKYALKQMRFPTRTPETKEEFWYRSIFEEFYPIHKMETVVHTKVYRTAAWQIPDDKENCKDVLLNIEAVRFRRRSTGSAKFSGVA
uniref:Asparagine synthetase [glutamine-hydrolyzing] n=1 Tax=Panagrellus redivivus TaxID=6233 RepID=A0A7E4UP90_PANRE